MRGIKNNNFTGRLIDSSNNPCWAWPFFTPEALNNSNRRWSPAKREAEPAEPAVKNKTAPTGAEQKAAGASCSQGWVKNLQYLGSRMLPLLCSTPSGVVVLGGLYSAGSASRFAELHRRLFLLHASGVETLANDSNFSHSAPQLIFFMLQTFFSPERIV